MEFAGEYNKIINSYKDYLDELQRLATHLIDSNEVKLAFPISGRVKTLDSIIEKHESGRYKIKKNITELDDLVGIRLVVLFPEHKEIIIELLKRTLNCEKERKFDPEVDRFSYSSIHLILTIPERWRNVPPWNKHMDKKIEVQVRTLSEHIWAETSHNLFYKGEENIPKAIKRDLYRLAALLEIADDKLQYVKNMVFEYFENIRKAPYEDILNMDLNPETLRRVFIKYFPRSTDEREKVFQILNRQIERDLNVQNVQYLDSAISQKLEEFSGTSFQEFVDFVFRILAPDVQN